MTQNVSCVPGTAVILIIGGNTKSNRPSNSILAFDPTAESIANYGTMRLPRSHHIAGAYKNETVISGGSAYNGRLPTASTELLNSKTAKITIGNKMSQPLKGAAGAVVGLSQGKLNKIHRQFMQAIMSNVARFDISTPVQKVAGVHAITFRYSDSIQIRSSTHVEAKTSKASGRMVVKSSHLQRRDGKR